MTRNKAISQLVAKMFEAGLGGYSVGEGEGESIDVVVQNKDVKFLRDLILENENEFCGYKVKITKAKGNVKVTDG